MEGKRSVNMRFPQDIYEAFDDKIIQTDMNSVGRVEKTRSIHTVSYHKRRIQVQAVQVMWRLVLTVTNESRWSGVHRSRKENGTNCSISMTRYWHIGGFLGEGTLYDDPGDISSHSGYILISYSIHFISNQVLRVFNQNLLINKDTRWLQKKSYFFIIGWLYLIERTYEILWKRYVYLSEVRFPLRFLS